MGRPIKKSWFSVREGSIAGDLTVTTSTGDEVIKSQKGTGVYMVDSGRVKLVDKTAGLEEGEASLQHDGKTVRKLAQYRVYYFDGSPSANWRDREGNVRGAFTPALTPEEEDGGGGSTATATAAVVGDAVDSITVTDGGSGYDSAPVVTVNGDGSGAAASATLSGDAVGSIAVDAGGTGYSAATVVVEDPAPAVVNALTSLDTAPKKKYVSKKERAKQKLEEAKKSEDSE